MLEKFDQLNQELSRKAKKRKPQKFHGNVDLKRILKPKAIKKTDKDTYTAMLTAAFPAFEKELKKYFDGSAKIIDDKQTLIELMTNKKFAKCLIDAIQELEQSPKILFYAISELWLTNAKAFVNDEKLLKKYLKLYADAEKGKIKKIAEALKIKKADALQISLASTNYRGAKMKSLRLRFQGFLNQMYGLEELTEKKVKKAIKLCFKGCENQFITYALGERPRRNDDEKENFSIVTNAILSILEDMDKDDRKNLLKFYAKRRVGNTNAPKRLNLCAISKEEYRGITKTIDKLIDTGMSKDAFQ